MNACQTVRVIPPGRPTRDRMILVSLACASLGAAAAPSPSSPPFRPPHRILRDEASLNDVVFVDGQDGWAVGNWGAVLHTTDAGRTWQMQESGTDATLEAVYFLNRQAGYAVGGRAWPEGGGGSGIVIATDDGGEHWRTTSTSRAG
jgi:hypothetical protein